MKLRAKCWKNYVISETPKWKEKFECFPNKVKQFNPVATQSSVNVAQTDKGTLVLTEKTE